MGEDWPRPIADPMSRGVIPSPLNKERCASRNGSSASLIIQISHISVYSTSDLRDNGVPRRVSDRKPRNNRRGQRETRQAGLPKLGCFLGVLNDFEVVRSVRLV